MPLELGMDCWMRVALKRLDPFSVVADEIARTLPFSEYLALFPVVELLLFLLHELIEFMEIDIGKNGGSYSALWCTTIGLMVLPVFDISCLQHRADKGQELRIRNSFFQQLHENLMVYVVVVPSDVDIDKPLGTLPTFDD